MAKKIIYIILTLYGFLFINTVIYGQENPVPEYQVKAVFLYNFSQFVSWPETSFESATSPFVVGIVGNDPFGHFLESVIQDEKYKNRPIVIKRFSSAEEVENCHILFISGMEENELAQIIEKTKNATSLTISDIPGFAHKGGVIEFYKSGNKIRLRINTTSANKSNLEISSKLLRLADIVSSEKVNK